MKEQRASTGELTNALEGLQNIAETIEAALNQVGYADTDEPGDTEDVSPGPFTDDQYMNALETIGAAVEAAEGLLEGVGMDDPDEAEDQVEASRTLPNPHASFRARLRDVETRRALARFEKRCGNFGEEERRTFDVNMEVRASGDPKNRGGFNVQGHASVADRKSLDLGGFREIIAPQAFDDVLARNGLDVHLLWDHDTGRPLARTLSEKYPLELKMDDQGLYFFARCAPTSVANDLRTLMDGGVIDQASFAFTVGDDKWEIRNEGQPDETVIRTVTRVAELYDVTITAQGAYPQTDSSVARARPDFEIGAAAARHYAETTGRLAHAEREAESNEVAPTAPQVETPEAPQVGSAEPPVAPLAGGDDKRAVQRAHLESIQADFRHRIAVARA